MPNPLDGARLRIGRGHKALMELRDLIDAWAERIRGGVTVMPDGSHRLGIFPYLDPMMSILVGEAVQSFRTALEYLVYELALLDSGRYQRNTKFPIYTDEQEFWSCRRTSLSGINDAHVDWIARVQPFHPGQFWSRDMQRISNADKHRRLWVLHKGSPVRSQVQVGIRFTESGAYTNQEGDRFNVEVDGYQSVVIDLSTPTGRPDVRPVLSVLNNIHVNAQRLVEAFAPDFPAEVNR